MDLRRILIRSLVVGIILLSVLLAWELSFRFPHPHDRAALQQMGRLTPNNTIEVVHPDRPHWIPARFEHKENFRSWLRFSYTTNDEGFRGRDFATPKNEEIFRILVAGDCVAFGFGVDDDEPYPVLLEERVDAAGGGHVAEVLNLSMFGLPPRGIADLLQEHGRALAPDLIIFAPGTDTAFVPEHVMSPARVNLGQGQYDLLLASYRDVLRRSVRFARGIGAPIVLVTPTINTFFLPDGIRWVEAMRDFAAHEKIPVLDTTALITEIETTRGLTVESDNGTQRLVRYRAKTPEVLFEAPHDADTDERHIAAAVYSWLDDHPDVRPVMNIDDFRLTPEGHQIVAEALHDFLKEHALLPE